MISARQHKALSLGAPALLWESMLTDWLARLYGNNPAQMLEARTGQRHIHIRQLHERHLDLLIATEIPKADEFMSERVGEFTLGLYTAGQSASARPFIRLDWGRLQSAALGADREWRSPAGE